MSTPVQAEISYNTLLMTFTPTDSRFQPIQYTSAVVDSQTEFLGPTQPYAPRANLNMSPDGQSYQRIQSMSNGGQRTLSLFYAQGCDRLLAWAQKKDGLITFDLEVRFQRNMATQNDAVIIAHRNCIIQNTPTPALNPDKAMLDFELQYVRLEHLDNEGNVLEAT